MDRSTRTLLAGLLLFASLTAAPAPAATTYRVTFYGNDVFQSTPVYRSGSYPVAASNGTAVFTGEGFSAPGHVGAFDRVDMTWDSDFSGGAGYEILCTARADDFVISGPAGPSVSGAMHFRFRASFARLGGFPNHGGHGSSIDVQAVANNLWATGTYAVNNAGTTTANGIFSGQSGNAVDLPFTISGSFPVGVPFFVDLLIDAHDGNYGNALNTNPGFAETNAGKESGPSPAGGLMLEETNGVVMDLPSGYTLTSPAWGVTNNHFTSTVSVVPGESDRGLSVTPNPASGEVRIEFAQPQSGPLRADLFAANGRHVRTLANRWFPAGRFELSWDGRSDDGARAGAGVYFARVSEGTRVLTRRVVRLE